MGVMLVPHGAISQNTNETSSRQKRLFSIFNIVTFKNDVCVSTGAGNLHGTCYDSTSCSSKGGTASGNCAAGFGVCCLFIVKGSCGSTQTISQNCTYIRNSGYPVADATPSETCTYEFNRICDNICQIRLDFKTLKTEDATTGICGTAADTILVTCQAVSFLSFPTPTLSSFCGGILDSTDTSTVANPQTCKH
ncbi:hypothetical protein TCAL_13416 [Tigriopus californicus]|uniref:CUB domain-containing protein n=1 Tax=Tigriopus californicus TaxID=6832 RepID=A0A553N7K7_TIGCA|nr:hypothetical protein TCAL_13416 [Tigriopus californicus]